MSSYDHGYPIPEWFVDKVRKAVTVDGWTRVALLERVNDLRGDREKEWDLTAITKFLNGGRRTIELASALGSAIDVPAPVVELETEDEALEVRRVLRRLRPAVKAAKVARR